MRVAKPWKCRLGFHDWDDQENRETHERYEVARRVRIGVAENSGHRARVASHTMAIGRQTGGSLAPDHSAGAKSFLKLGLFSSTTGEEAGMAVAGVAGVLSLRGDNVTDLFWDLAPGLGRITGTGRLAFPAVRQPGEGADRVGVGRTLGGLAVAGDLPCASRAGRPAEQDRGGEHGRRRGS